MDNNKDNTFEVPSDEVQDKITLLMGLPHEEAAARLDKVAPPRRLTAQQARHLSSDPVASVQTSGATAIDTPTVAQTTATDDSVQENTDEDKAVDDIVRHESDEALEIADKKTASFVATKKPKGLRRLISGWWNNKLMRNLTIAVIALVIILLFAIPDTRYTLLNTAGIRASIQFQVTDQISGHAIKNVEVTINGQTAKTGDDGYVKITNLPLGDTTITLKKRSFKEESIPVTLGWGSNPFDAPMELLPTGSTFTFKINDWLSGLPLEKAEVSDGESVGVADVDGVAKLTIEPTDSDISVSFTANGYKSSTSTIPADQLTGDTVALVPAGRDVFVSKRQGKFDIYSRYADGSGEEMLLGGTGSEQDDTNIMPNPSTGMVAVVSSRAGERNADGYIKSDLYMINPDTKQVEKIADTSTESIRLIGWVDDSIVFVKTAAGPSAYTSRQHIVSYDVSDAKLNDIAKADYFADVRVIGPTVYYSLSSSDGTQSAGVTKTDILGRNKQVLLAKNVWSVFRSSLQTLQVYTDGQEWYEIALASSKVNKLDGAPPSPQNKEYVVSRSNGQFAWYEERDGKTVLIVADSDGKNEKVVVKQSGITLPVRWLNDTTLIYAVSNGQETAEYVVSTRNNIVKKVGDITLTNSGRYYM